MRETIMKLAGEYGAQLIDLRRELHRTPELGFEEHATSQRVADLMEAAGIEVTRGIAQTGVAGVIHGALPGKTLLLRADMDALPVQEENDCEYRSRCDGKMHACGHDAHTAWLLGAALILNRIRDRLPGTVKIVFQPCEEASPCGSELMIQDGVMENPHVDMAMGAHVSPAIDVGRYLIQDGPASSNPDFFTLNIHGKGAHGSEPQNAVDPINIAVQIYNIMQSFVSRLSNPNDEVVFSVCVFRGGTARGVIPEDCELSGTVRSFRPEIQQQAKTFLENTAKSVCALYGATYDLDYRIACFPVMNDPEVAEGARQGTAELLGKEAVITKAEKNMGGEDFCFFSRAVPSAFLFAGVRNEDKFHAVPLHNPRFQIDEDAIPLTAAVLAYNAWRALGGCEE